MYEQACYKKPFLQEVIARVDFVAALEGLEKVLPPKLAKEVLRYFPISEPVDAIERELQFSKTELHQRETRFKQWNFFGKEREKQLAIAAPFAFVSYKRYSTYEEMNAEFTSVVQTLEKAFPDARARRLGLRFINVIDDANLLSATDWGEYIDQKLLGTLAFFHESRQLTRLIQVTELKYDDLDVRFQFGLPNPDYPALMKRPQFVLDLDAYVQVAHDLGEALKYIDQAHERIQDLFERSITDKLRERMNVRPAQHVQE